ncbi:23S rRNA (adenine(2030)-N(6))-methyltransferase RlmJ [Lichenicoccus sp.]|uniref:23S rRNA (adenine(2030)-N(6))-methyltransferase RlmJ n=1 Tax=Lichenicoccus sp. TaxID=2781899 RepID=UPI003D1011F2
MNYRHAFHAGNLADCMKHALLVWVLRALQRKPGALFVLDTHAGAGRTDLAGSEATRTGEWRAGIGRLLAAPASAALADYLSLVRGFGDGVYPGSPLLTRALLRDTDRLACCELHSEAHAGLRLLFARDPHVAVHRRDGWQALAALLPPRGQTRGLVLIDPPFEQPDEFDRIAASLRLARRRFPGGVVAAWYPIKHRAPLRAFHDALREAGEPDLLCAELLLRPPLDASRLNGSGLLVAGAPWGFAQAAADILDAIADTSGETGAHARVGPLQLIAA